jgi:hypothetical protein
MNVLFKISLGDKEYASDIINNTIFSNSNEWLLR